MINARVEIEKCRARIIDRDIADNRSSRLFFLIMRAGDVMSVKTSVLIKALSMRAERLGYVTRYLLGRWYLRVTYIATHGDEANYAGNIKKNIARPRNMK